MLRLSAVAAALAFAFGSATASSATPSYDDSLVSHKTSAADVLAAAPSCCFLYGYGAMMVPCCLNVVSCESEEFKQRTANVTA